MDDKRGSKTITGNEKMQLTYSCESTQEIIGKKDIDVSISGDEHIETEICKSLGDEPEEKLSKIIKWLIAQKEGEIQTSKDILLEAFQVFGSEEVSYQEKISHEDVQSLGDSKKTEEVLEVVSKQPPKRKCNFFSMKWKLQERGHRCGVAKTIVVLKPGPDDLDVTHSTGNKSKHRRTISRFLIGLIKRRLKSPVGKKSCDDLVDRSQNCCMQEEIQSETGKQALDEGIDEADKEDTVQASKDSNKIMSGLYIEAKKHLSEMLANGDLPDKKVSRILGKILSLPEFSSPADSPVHDLVSTTEEQQILQRSSTTNDLIDSDKQDETLVSIDVDKEEKTETGPLSERKEPATEVQGKLSPVSVLEPLLTDDESSPTTRTRFSSAEMRMQPHCIRFGEADSPKPDNVNNVKTSMDDKELTLAYIEAVVKSSGLNWEELLTRPFYSDQLLEPELTDDIVFCCTELCDDENLLYDCTNEVLMNFCENEINPGPWISFVKTEYQLISDMEIAVKVAQEGVYWHLIPLPSPHTLDQIVKKDMARPESWMDLRCEISCIGSYTGEMILDELIEDIIRS